MTGRPVMLISVFILLFGSLQISLADEDTFSISKTLSLWNEEPAVAVNSNTGDILVVWHRFDQENRNDSKVYATLCRLKKDGSLKINKPRLLSDKKETCSMPFAAYDVESNTYFVTWRIEQPTIEDQSGADIQGRVLNAKGKTVGDIIAIVATTDRRETRTVIAAVPQSTRKAAKKAAYLMSWETNPTDTADYADVAGLWTVLLNDKGKKVSQPNRVINMDFIPVPFQSGETSPYRIISTENVPFYLSMINVKLTDDDRVQETYIVTLDEMGAYSDKVLLDSGLQPINPAIAMVSDKRLLASWYNFRERRCRNQLLESTLKKKKRTYLPAEGNSYQSELVSLADGGAFQIISTFPTFHTAHFNAKGKMSGECVEHTPPAAFVGNFTAVEIRGTGTVLMIWRRSTGENDTEIAGTLLDVK